MKKEIPMQYNVFAAIEAMMVWLETKSTTASESKIYDYTQTREKNLASSDRYKTIFQFLLERPEYKVHPEAIFSMSLDRHIPKIVGDQQ